MYKKNVLRSCENFSKNLCHRFEPWGPHSGYATILHVSRRMAL